MSQPFDLNALIRTVAAESTDADPEIVAKDVRDRIADQDVAAALDQALRHAVYHLARNAPRNSTPVDQEDGDSQCVVVGGSAPISHRVARIQNFDWRRHLRERVSVGDGEWKFYGDCFVADLEAVADIRYALADSNRAAGDWHLRTRDLVAEHCPGGTVADLPNEVAAAHFTRKEAA